MLQKEVKSQGQKSGIPLFFATAGHQQEQQYYQQVRRVQIPGQEIFQESTGRTGRIGRRFRRWAGGLRGMFVGMLLGNAVFPVSTVGLRNVTVINGNHLPGPVVWRLPGPIWLPAWLFPVFADEAPGDKAPVR